MPLYEVSLAASRRVWVHADDYGEAEDKALSANPTLDEVEATDCEELDEDPTHYDELPPHVQAVVDQVEEGAELERLGIGQTGDRVYDDGEWRVWRERVGPADGYHGPEAVVEYYDGNRWQDFTGRD